MFSVHIDKQLKDVTKTDLIFIPALFGDMPTAVAKNQNLVPWIVEQYGKGAEVASLCVGAFLLTSTGLLDGKSVQHIGDFKMNLKKCFPKLRLLKVAL